MAWGLMSGLLAGCAGIPPPAAEPNQAIVDAVARVLPAVVDVEVTAAGPAARILGKERRGTGVVVTPDGHILTASHVILGAESLKVTFSSGQQFPAEITATDSESGLALLHIPLLVRGGDRQAFSASPLQAPEGTQ
jgi:S1-C subfamily serine protease